MCRLAFVPFALLALAVPALAQSYDDPRAMLEAFYAPYLADGEFPDNENSFRSDALNALFEADEERTAPGELGALDFDPYINGQDYQISDLEIGEPAIEGDRATVLVTFDNFDQPNEITYDLVNEHGGWRIDDVAGVNGAYSYRLSDILSAPLDE